MSLPKSPDARQRRNLVPGAAVLTTDDAPSEAPPLPKLPGRVAWRPQAIEWWEAVWASPMAGRFLEADRHSLNRLAVLVNSYWREPNEKTYTAICRGEQRFGLTPLDRNRLQWSIVPAEPVAKRAETEEPDDPRITMLRKKAAN